MLMSGGVRAPPARARRGGIRDNPAATADTSLSTLRPALRRGRYFFAGRHLTHVRHCALFSSCFILFHPAILGEWRSDEGRRKELRTDCGQGSILVREQCRERERLRDWHGPSILHLNSRLRAREDTAS